MASSKQPDQAANANLSSLGDAELVAACLSGDEQAWMILIDRYSPLIYTIPLRFGLPKVIADEVFQETCLILLEKLDTLREKDQISSWIMTVARRACIQRWRRKHIQTVTLQDTDPLPDMALEEELVRLEQQYLVHLALAKLPPRCQHLLKALFFTDPPLSYEEIATELSVSTGSIGPTRTRCLEKLKQEMGLLE